jgi:hypothetical protein
MQSIQDSDILDKLPPQHQSPISTAELLKRLFGTKWEMGTKSIINKALYRLEKEKKTAHLEGTPPLWYRIIDIPIIDVTNNNNATPSGSVIIFVDVDNSHCLKEACAYASPSIQIIAYASPAYNHYVPPADSANIKFEKLTSDLGGRDAADVMFIMEMTDICSKRKQNPPHNLTFLIVSKDKLLHSAGKMHEHKFGIKAVTITDGWEELKTYLE